MNSAAISLCMNVRDEEEVLERCLSSIAHIVDEIIIVDSGSTDRTKEIAKKYTDKIYDFEWKGDFSEARNFSFSKATKEYIMWLDADDVVPEKSQKQILEFKKNLATYKMDVVVMEYQYSYNAEGNPILTQYRNNIVRRACNFKWKGLVHAKLDYSDTEEFITNIVIHHKKNKLHTDRTLKTYESLIEQGKNLSVEDLFYYANECISHKQYKEAKEWYQKYLNENTSNDECNIYAYGQLADCHTYFNELDQAILCCLHTFKINSPRAEICCKLAYIYYLKKEIEQTISWFKIATATDFPTKSTFIKPHYYTWFPHIQLCTCYLSQGNYNEAKKHNDIAATYIPNNSYVKGNETLLEELKIKIEQRNAEK
ncbi:tetratricopeptide repeat-containing glycosyltransferase family 2 protein [Chengkuizengella axinellae]|uniref:Glycosyltransferase family 2 protein n=1 Tax=Chengkuizengella axinellae TaxID=3064388 RepID=A0ABT9J1N9_9BACL|nr:glycosyltransferase family 2 protein [Chengkuizengella sp. 2205SS18-9]MDP5275495.1 glycosyltransferase family 2 protein [Chengkuizengella sp. 2205SS18-9]